MEKTLFQLRNIIKAIGENPDREGLVETPKRIFNSWKELYAGYKQDPEKILGKTFESDGYDQMVILKDIELYSNCEHHNLPFIGKAHVAYLPNKRVVGISKLARLVDCFARRMQIQERLTEEVANSIDKVLSPQGVIVVVEAQHLCMRMRGVQKQNSIMVTSAVRGCFKEDNSIKQEFFNLIRD
jgi:GTP cyclohydrolase I